MKKIFLFFVLLCFAHTQAQQKSIELSYDVKLLFDEIPLYKGSLFSDGNQNAFFVLQEKSVDIIKNSSKIKMENFERAFLTQEDKTVELMAGVKEKQVIIEENKPEIAWNIDSTPENIEGYECYKATADFAGRSYTAWFTIDIPITHGVFRLHGLPGAMVKLVDVTGEIEVVLTKVKEIENFDYTHWKEKMYANKKTTRKEHIEQVKKELTEINDRMKSKQPEGFSVGISIVNAKLLEYIE